MSILVVEVLPQGMIFGADRNITNTFERIDTSQPGIVIKHTRQGQRQRPKVLKWQNRKALVGYVGAATIGGEPTDEWLFDFIGDHLTFDSFGELAKELRSKIDDQRNMDEDELILHLGGFEERKGYTVPVVYLVHIRKTRSGESDKFKRNFPNVEPKDIKAELESRTSNYDPFWFHQGFDLGTFNTLEAFLKAAFKLLCNKHPSHSLPTTLIDWEKNLKMSILTYESYFESFKDVNEQFVGGGVDTVKLEWP